MLHWETEGVDNMTVATVEFRLADICTDGVVVHPAVYPKVCVKTHVLECHV